MYMEVVAVIRRYVSKPGVLFFCCVSPLWFVVSLFVCGFMFPNEMRFISSHISPLA